MKKFFALLLFACTSLIAFAQNNNVDSLRQQLASAKDDSTKLFCLSQLFNEYLWSYPDSSITYVQQEILLAKQMKSELALSNAYFEYGSFYIIIGDYPQAVRSLHESLKLGEKNDNFLAIARAYDQLVVVYMDMGDYERALYHEKMAKSIMDEHWTLNFNKPKKIDTVKIYLPILNGLAQVYEKLNQLDSALKYVQILDDAYLKINGKKWSAASYELGNIYLKMENYSAALQHYKNGVSLARDIDNKKDLMDNYNGMANTFKKLGQFDSSIFYANEVLEVGKAAHYPLVKLEALKLLSDVYKSKHNTDSTAKYLELTLSTTDSLFNHQKLIQIQSITFNEQLRQQEIQEEQEQYQTRIRTYILIGGLAVLLLITGILYRNSIQKQKAKTKIEQAYNELKSTQAQLVQRAKMASLGELTAGIAHEIQNPLNFVNNFSEVNTELISEMQQEIDKRNIEEVKAIADDIEGNEQKIIHHGKRADAIVKGMLQHSRVSSGQKESTDINAFAEEYLRLSYRSMRAKDETFNATLKTDFDTSIEKVNIVPEDIGRVLLNLFHNAFYSVMQRNASTNSAGQQYLPIISVCTKKLDGKVEIHVKDNGVGIPESVVDKIFQPFFTTKPTGQGTGLGLSLSYDIIKAHGGEIKVETPPAGKAGKEGEGAEFVIQLPMK